jgi:type II secretory pathway pseudopilin PulG
MLVVIAIIGVLAAMLLPAVQAAREAARRTQCLNNIRQFGIAYNSYIDTVGRFPPGSLNFSSNDPIPWLRGSRITFVVHILPYMEQDALYNRFDFKEPSDGWGGHSYSACVDTPNSIPGPDWQAPTSVMIPFFYCPSDPGRRIYEFRRRGLNHYSLSNYLGIFGDKDYGLMHGVGSDYDGQPARQPGDKRFRYHVFGINFGAKPAHITDGKSNTMVMAEYLRAREGGFQMSDGNMRDSRGNIWLDQPGKSMLFTRYTPNAEARDIFYPEQCDDLPQLNLPCEAAGSAADAAERSFASARSMHAGGVVVILLADGSARFIHESIDVRIWRSLGTINNQDMILEEF